MKTLGSVLVGHTNQRVSEGLRDWLQASFQRVFIVADLPSLLEGAQRLEPALMLVDGALAAGELGALVTDLRQAAPSSRILLICRGRITVGDIAALSPGRDGVLHIDSLAGDLAAAIGAVLDGHDFTPPAPDAWPGSVASQAGNPDSTEFEPHSGEGDESCCWYQPGR